MAADAQMADLVERLSAIRFKIKVYLAFDGIAHIALRAIVLLAAFFILDYVFFLPAFLRVIFSACLLGYVAVNFWRRVIPPLRARLSDRDIALLIERKYPNLKDKLISAIEFAEAQEISRMGSPELAASVIEEAIATTSMIEIESVVTVKRVRWSYAAGIIAVLAAVTLTYQFPDYASIFFGRMLGGVRNYPGETELAYENLHGEVVVGLGDNLKVSVQMGGRKRSGVTLEWVSLNGGDVVKVDMAKIEVRGVPSTEKVEVKTPGEAPKSVATVSRNPGKFDYYEYTIENISSDFKLRAYSGPVSAPTIVVRAKEPPKVKDINIFVTPPKYLGIEPTAKDKPIKDSTITVVSGTRIRFDCICDQTLDTATLKMFSPSTEKALPCQVDANNFNLFSTEVLFDSEGDFDYVFILRSKGGFSNSRVADKQEKRRVRVITDKVPSWSPVDPTEGEMVVPDCERPFEFKTEDDFGLRYIKMQMRKTEGSSVLDWTSTDMTRDQNDTPYGSKKITSRLLLKFADLKVQKGDQVEVKFEVADYFESLDDKQKKRENILSTQPFRFDVVSVSELEQKLEEMIQDVKRYLEEVRNVQNIRIADVDRFIKEFTGDTLNESQQKDLTEAFQRQRQIIDGIRGAENSRTSAIKRLRLVLRRGQYNKIFDENARGKLEMAIALLEDVVSDTGPGPSAAAQIRNCITAPKKERTSMLVQAKKLQLDVISDIDQVLAILRQWSNYMEVVRVAREAKSAQENVIKWLKK